MQRFEFSPDADRVGMHRLNRGGVNPKPSSNLADALSTPGLVQGLTAVIGAASRRLRHRQTSAQ
jgi:hypothetical protein